MKALIAESHPCAGLCKVCHSGYGRFQCPITCIRRRTGPHIVLVLPPCCSARYPASVRYRALNTDHRAVPFTYHTGWSSCFALLNDQDALWFAPSPSGHWFRDQWHPETCMLKQYSTRLSVTCTDRCNHHKPLRLTLCRPSSMMPCLTEKSIAFVGDSRARQLYESFVASHDRHFVPGDKEHTDLSFKTYWLISTLHLTVA